MSNEETQPILDYTARDFDAIRSMLVGIAKGKMPELQTLGEANDFMTLLLELYAYMGDVNNYYIDRVGSEAFLGTAQRRQSVLYIAEMLGYRPLGQQAASALVSFTLDADYGEDVEIPSSTYLTSNADNSADVIKFTTDYTITLSPGETKQVSVTEGEYVVESFSPSKSTPNYEVVLANTGVVNRSVLVRTKEGANYGSETNLAAQYVFWQEVTAVATALPTQSAYSTYLDDQGFTHILFGDGAAGRIPPSGAPIEVSYRFGAGAKANSLGVGSITNISSTTLPVANLTVTNEEAPVGGSDPESIESMRFSIPKASSIRNRAVTLDDYTSLALRVPGVAKAVAYGQTYSAVNIRIAPVGGVLDTALMADLRSDVEVYLADKVLIGSTIYVEDAQWTDIWIDLDLYVIDGFNREQVQSAVQVALEESLSFDNRDFGGRVSVGNVYRTAMAVEGVDYVDVNTLRTATTTGVANREISDLHIARIHPSDEALGNDGDGNPIDPYGLTITSHGGLGT